MNEPFKYRVLIKDTETGQEIGFHANYILGVINHPGGVSLVKKPTLDFNVIYEAHKMMLDYLHGCFNIGVGFVSALNKGKSSTESIDDSEYIQLQITEDLKNES